MNTHEEKLRAILPEKTADFVRNSIIIECFDAIKSKVIMRDELLTDLNDYKDRCGCVNLSMLNSNCCCNEIELFLKKAGLV
jgi:hypothetical protein